MKKNLALTWVLPILCMILSWVCGASIGASLMRVKVVAAQTQRDKAMEETRFWQQTLKGLVEGGPSKETLTLVGPHKED